MNFNNLTVDNNMNITFKTPDLTGKTWGCDYKIIGELVYEWGKMTSCKLIEFFEQTWYVKKDFQGRLDYEPVNVLLDISINSSMFIETLKDLMHRKSILSKNGMAIQLDCMIYDNKHLEFQLYQPEV